MANAEGCNEILTSILAAAERRYGVPPGEASATSIEELTGTYELRDGYALEIGTADGHLTLGAPRQAPVRRSRFPVFDFGQPLWTARSHSTRPTRVRPR